MSDEVESKTGVYVRVPDSGHAPGRWKFYTIEELVRSAYQWGRADATADANDRTRTGIRQGWTLGGIPIDELRRDTSSARRD
jgi:hypothetical protein